VILGEIGKNFAAGMSGGIAYIYDPEEKCTARINREMVDLERIEGEEESSQIREMITRYVTYTASAEAEAILLDWEETKTAFVKVMPRDYKRVLQEQAAKVKEV